jgi:hypothetical protein
LLAICAVVCVACVAAVRRFPAPQADAGTFAALATERDRLRPNADAVRDELRQQARTAASPEWTDSRIAGLQRQLGPMWAWTIEPRTAGTDRRATVRAVALELTRWPAYLRGRRVDRATAGHRRRTDRLRGRRHGRGAEIRSRRHYAALSPAKARTPGSKERAAALTARSLFSGATLATRRRKVAPFLLRFARRPPAATERLRFGGKARPFLHGPLTA